MDTVTNWAGNYRYSTTNVHHPETLEQIQAVVKQCNKLRVLGSRHSFNGIADSTENLLAMDRFAPVVAIDREKRTASISANVRYGELCGILHREGFALHNLASLPHISVIGACTTATHGSGVHNQNLASAVSAMEFVTADGELVSLSRDHDGERFEGAVVGLGGLGVVVRLTLDMLPAYDMSQDVYQNLPMAQVEAHFDEIMASAYSVSLFTDWQHDSINQVWLKRRSDDPGFGTVSDNFFGATPATRTLHPVVEVSADACTAQLGVRGAWHERLPHFRIDAVPSVGNELQTEYFVPRRRAVAALQALSTLRQEVATLLLISEVRTIAADNFWMSPSYQRDTVAFHFTWIQDWQLIKPVLPLIEAQLAPFDAVPHWGKVFTMSPQQFQPRYERLPQFRQLLQEYDPHGKFRNAFLDANIFTD